MMVKVPHGGGFLPAVIQRYNSGNTGMTSRRPDLARI
jgi:hypothetical protein